MMANNFHWKIFPFVSFFVVNKDNIGDFGISEELFVKQVNCLYLVLLFFIFITVQILLSFYPIEIESLKMNLTLSALCLSLIKTGPVLTIAQQTSKSRVAISKCAFSRIFSHALFLNPKSSSFIYQTRFKKSLDSVILLDSFHVIMENNEVKDLDQSKNRNLMSPIVEVNNTNFFEYADFRNKTFYYNCSDSFVMESCSFSYCIGHTGSSVLDLKKSSKLDSFKLTVKECRFMCCVTILDSCLFKLNGGHLDFLRCCTSYCRSHYAGQAFQTQNMKKTVINETHFYLTSPTKCPGINSIVSLENGAMAFVYNNLTQCHVVEHRCLGDFYNPTSIHYQYIMNLNCSGRTYLGFCGGSNNLSTNICDSVLVRCLPHNNYAIAMFELEKSITISRFIFIRSKMVFQCMTRSKNPFSVIFKDCVTDSPKRQSDSNKCKFINVTFNADYVQIPQMTTNFSNWSCRTLPFPTPLPTQSPSPKRSPKQTPFPSMTMEYVLGARFFDPDMNVIQEDDKNHLLGVNDFIQLIILAILVVATVVIFYLAKRRARQKINQDRKDETEKLLP